MSCAYCLALLLLLRNLAQNSLTRGQYISSQVNTITFFADFESLSATIFIRLLNILQLNVASVTFTSAHFCQ